MTKTLVGTPDPPADPDAGAKFLESMTAHTDVELVAAYIDLAQGGLPWVHPSHVLRLLKLAANGLRQE